MLRFVASEWSRRSRRSLMTCSVRDSSSSRCDFTALKKVSLHFDHFFLNTGVLPFGASAQVPCRNILSEESAPWFRISLARQLESAAIQHLQLRFVFRALLSIRLIRSYITKNDTINILLSLVSSNSPLSRFASGNIELFGGLFKRFLNLIEPDFRRAEFIVIDLHFGLVLLGQN